MRPSGPRRWRPPGRTSPRRRGALAAAAGARRAAVARQEGGGDGVGEAGRLVVVDVAVAVAAAALLPYVGRGGVLIRVRLLQRDRVHAGEGVPPWAGQRRRARRLLGREEGEDAAQRAVPELADAVLSPLPSSSALHRSRTCGGRPRNRDRDGRTAN
jgi:hypothetical protein